LQLLRISKIENTALPPTFLYEHVERFSYLDFMQRSTDGNWRF